jgi:hypothetical protein
MLADNPEDQVKKIFGKVEGGYELVNFRPSGTKEASSSIERHLAYSLNCMGITQVFGYNTSRDHGIAEMINSEGKSEGQTTIFVKGFEKKVP